VYLAGPGRAQQVLLDFAEFRRAETTEYQATPGGEITSRGFDVYAAYGGSSRNALGTWGTQQDPTHLPANLGPTSAALWGTAFGERMDLEASDGRLFNLYSMDVAHMYPRSYLVSGDLSPISLFVYGFNSAGQTIASSSFAIAAPALVGGEQTPALTTLVFGNSWRSLSYVAWFQGSGPAQSGFTAPVDIGSGFSHQFTNISAEIVPEPGTYALLATGLAGVFVLARRRRDA
jgi:hypothetical protein